MSNQEGQFDELIRQKFAEKEFIFNEENWEKMENKIASERKIGRITLWSSIFSIGLISGIAISYLLMNTFSTDSNTIAKIGRAHV